MGWVCLMYHDVTPLETIRGGGPERFSVSVESFERMLDEINEAGCQGCSLAQALELRGQPRVAITFDDGTMGQFAYAVPALRRRNMTATFFVTSDWVGTPGFASWDQLRQMTAWGMSVQSHTRSHPFLSELDGEQLGAELSESKLAIDRALDQETDQIALPGGDAPRGRSRKMLAAKGYRVVACSRWGVNADDGFQQDGARWVYRCTVPSTLTGDLARRIVFGDRRMAAARIPRELALNGLRRILGPSRYARLRRRALDVLSARPA